jgi:hypothetical protein
MKIVRPSIVIAILATTLVRAQHACEPIASTFPSCARGCINQDVVSQLGCASDSDYDCLCDGKGEQLQSLVKSCVIDACGLWTASSIPTKAEELCGCVRSEKEKSEL